MGEVAEKLGAGSTPTGGKDSYVSEGIMFFRSQNIYNHGLKLDNVAYITDTVHTKMKNTKVRPKDILLNITGGSIGRSTLISDEFTTANVSQHVAIVRMISLDFRQFIHTLIISPYFQDKIMEVQVGMSREGLSMGSLKQLVIPVPSINEQKKIVRQVDFLMELCDYLTAQIKKKKAITKDWMTSSSRHALSYEKVDALTMEKKFNVAAEIVTQLNGEMTLGHVKLQKLLYFCQEAKDIKLGANFLQQRAGPYDPKLAREVDMYLEYYEMYLFDETVKLKYRLLPKHGSHKAEYNKLPKAERDTISTVIDLFRKTKSHEIGMYATLHAVWKKAKGNISFISDELLLRGFFDWSEEKKDKYSRDEVMRGIRWMEEQGIIK